MTDALVVGEDGKARCYWAGSAPEYIAYHDDEWGKPVTTDQGLYERMTLEAFQSGLAWITILRKREGFRAAFAGFDIDAVAAFGEEDFARLMADVGIVRNRLKIEAAINNARAAQDVGLADLIWSHRARSAPAAAAPPRRGAGDDAGVGGAGQGLEEGRVPLRRADDRLRDDAGLRARGRPLRGLPCSSA